MWSFGIILLQTIHPQRVPLAYTLNAEHLIRVLLGMYGVNDVYYMLDQNQPMDTIGLDRIIGAVESTLGRHLLRRLLVLCPERRMSVN